MNVLIDPAAGWQYGFPKPYTPKPGQSRKDWLIENGYPAPMAEAVERGELWCRYVGSADDLKRAVDGG